MSLPELGSRWSHDGGDRLHVIQIDHRPIREGGRAVDSWFVIGVQDNRGFRFDIPENLWPPDGYMDDAKRPPHVDYRQAVRELLARLQVALNEDGGNSPRITALLTEAAACVSGEVAP